MFTLELSLPLSGGASWPSRHVTSIPGLRRSGCQWCLTEQWPNNRVSSSGITWTAKCCGQVEMEQLLAAHGSTAALRDMGYRALTGGYADADDATALRHLTAAAAAGDAVSAFNLGFMHLNGLGARPHPQNASPDRGPVSPVVV